MYGSAIISDFSRKGLSQMADTANIIEKAHKRVTLKAPKEAHSVDERSERSVVMCLLALWCFFFSVRADITNDVDIIRQEIQELRGLISNQTIEYYNWSQGSPDITQGTEYSIVYTLYNIALGLHDSIYPALQRIDNTTSNLVDIADLLQQIKDTSLSVESKLSRIDEYVNYIYQYQSSIFDKVYSIDNYVSYIYNDFLSFKSSFDNFKDLTLTYLQSIDNNVGVIAQLQSQIDRNIESIYNSISSGINVNIANGFPEPIDYTALLERISYNNLWGNYDDYSYNRVGNRYISGGITWTYLNDLSTNTVVKDGINLSGDFFSDVVDILSCSDEKLASIQKSLMILCQNTQSNNVQDVDIDNEATDGIPTDTMDEPSDITSGLSFQSSSGYLTLPEIKGLDGKQFPTFVDMEVPHMLGNGGGTISINLTKYSPAIEQARNILLFFYWSITAILFVLLYRLFSKYVLSNLMKLAFAFVQKGKSV